MQPARLERLAGLLVDLKLLQLDCLEALAEALQEGSADDAQAAAAARPGQAAGSGAAAAAGAASDAGLAVSDEARALLGEAELLAAELYAD